MNKIAKLDTELVSLLWGNKILMFGVNFSIRSQKEGREPGGDKEGRKGGASHSGATDTRFIFLDIPAPLRKLGKFLHFFKLTNSFKNYL